MSTRTAGMLPRLALPKASLATISRTLVTQALEAVRVPTRSVSMFLQPFDTGSPPAQRLETRHCATHTLRLSVLAGASTLIVRYVLDKVQLVAELCRVSTNI